MQETVPEFKSQTALTLGSTERTDIWWLQPAMTVLGLIIGFGYLTWAAFLGDPLHGEFGSYLTPLYSPPVYKWFPSLMNWFNWLPIKVTPALLILWAPGGFRGSCYFYRRAYYRSVFFSPPACGVQGIPRKNYMGEKYLLLFQNLHRYFLYIDLFFIVFLFRDAFRAMWFVAGDGSMHFGLAVGTIVLFINVLFLSLYTFGCHSFRHLIGGKLDCFSCSAVSRTRSKIWSKASILNENHMLWAWVSLFFVGFTDFYIRMCANGIFKDFRLF